MITADGFSIAVSDDWKPIAKEMGILKKSGEGLMSKYKMDTDVGVPGFPFQGLRLNGKKEAVCYVVPPKCNLAKSTIRSLIESPNILLGISVNGTQFEVPAAISGDIAKSGKTSLAFSESNSSPAYDRRLDSFLQNVGVSNGHMVGPALSNFVSVVKKTSPPVRKMLTGYMSVIDFCHKVNMNYGAYDSAFGKTGSLLVPASVECEVSESDGKLNVNLPNLKPIQSSIKDGKYPFILFSTYPLKLSGKAFPYRHVNYAGVGVFLSALKIRPDMLAKLKGGMRLNP
jgi:hypothetical protein